MWFFLYRLNRQDKLYSLAIFSEVFFVSVLEDVSSYVHFLCHKVYTQDANYCDSSSFASFLLILMVWCCLFITTMSKFVIRLAHVTCIYMYVEIIGLCIHNADTIPAALFYYLSNRSSVIKSVIKSTPNVPLMRDVETLEGVSVIPILSSCTLFLTPFWLHSLFTPVTVVTVDGEKHTFRSHGSCW